MPVRQDEAIPVQPLWIARIVLQVVIPQDLRDIGHAHGGAGMSRICGLHGIHTQGTNCVGEMAPSGLKEIKGLAGLDKK